MLAKSQLHGRKRARHWLLYGNYCNKYRLALAVNNGQHYAGLGVNLLVLDVDGKGGATAVTPIMTRTKLEMKSS